MGNNLNRFDPRGQKRKAVNLSKIAKLQAGSSKFKRGKGNDK
jgi:hypothetical protein